MKTVIWGSGSGGGVSAMFMGAVWRRDDPWCSKVASYITSADSDLDTKQDEPGFEEISSIEIEVEDIGWPRPSGGLENGGASWVIAREASPLRDCNLMKLFVNYYFILSLKIKQSIDNMKNLFYKKWAGWPK